MSEESTPFALSSVDAMARLKAAIDSGRGYSLGGVHSDAGLSCDIRVFRTIAANPVAKNLSEDDLAKLNAYLHHEGLASDIGLRMKALDEQPEYMYFAMAKFLESGPATDAEARRMVTGIYWLYRPSLKIPGVITVGMLNIKVDKHTNAICVHEFRKFDPDRLSIDTPLYAGGEAPSEVLRELRKRLKQEDRIEERLDGNMVRKRRRYLSLQKSFQSQGSSFVFSVFDDEFVSTVDLEESVNPGRIGSMRGISVGSRGNRLYASRIFVERVTIRDLQNCWKMYEVPRLEEKDKKMKEPDFHNPTIFLKWVETWCNYQVKEDIKPSAMRNLEMPVMAEGSLFHIF